MSPEIHCPTCRKKIFDGSVLVCRCLFVGQTYSKAKCTQCKTLVTVPVGLVTQRGEADTSMTGRAVGGSLRQRRTIGLPGEEQ